MDKKQLKHHAARLEKAMESLATLDDTLIEKAREANLRLDFVRAWTIAPRSKKEKPMPPITLYGTSLVTGKTSALSKLEKDLANTLKNMERL
ncbi:hypothetical protein [Flavobacterium selenitireducens]|uniref:hypothetical protein n=1 Tax=Flavobacterium selenitireducens TaxID=2722704 RepID=UPI00168AA29A|nr:hypothetical protein [Flavobacterium selenitireducens]MBD3581268.1 hypothetical protein [Flavobacterium selenitireducens]